MNVAYWALAALILTSVMFGVNLVQGNAVFTIIFGGLTVWNTISVATAIKQAQ